MSFFKEHLPGCTPLHPCKNCEVALFLKSRLTAESLVTLSEMMEKKKPIRKPPVQFPVPSPVTLYIDKELNQPLDTLELSVRSADSLKAAGLRTIGDLVTKTEHELLQCDNLGRISVNGIKEVLATTKGLELGMKPELA